METSRIEIKEIVENKVLLYLKPGVEATKDNLTGFKEEVKNEVIREYGKRAFGLFVGDGSLSAIVVLDLND